MKIIIFTKILGSAFENCDFCDIIDTNNNFNWISLFDFYNCKERMFLIAKIY